MENFIVVNKNDKTQLLYAMKELTGGIDFFEMLAVDEFDTLLNEIGIEQDEDDDKISFEEFVTKHNLNYDETILRLLESTGGKIEEFVASSDYEITDNIITFWFN